MAMIISNLVITFVYPAYKRCLERKFPHLLLQLVGLLCAISGVLVMSIPIPIMVR